MSRVQPKNFRNFFVDHIRDRAVTAFAHGFEVLGDDSVLRSEGKVRIPHHGKVIFRVACADQDFPAQLLLELTGRFGLGDAFGMDINDPGGGAEDFAELAEFFPQTGFAFIDTFEFFRAAVIQICYRGLTEFSVKSNFQKSSQIVTGLCQSMGTVLMVALCFPHEIFHKTVMCMKALHLYSHVGKHL